MSAGERIVLEGCAVATVDGDGTEHADGHVVVEGGRIAAVGPGAAPAADGPQRRVDASGCLATPGLVNCHHHLYQWATRGLAQEATLFEWLQALYPIWAHVDEEVGAGPDTAVATVAALSDAGLSYSEARSWLCHPTRAASSPRERSTRRNGDGRSAR